MEVQRLGPYVRAWASALALARWKPLANYSDLRLHFTALICKIKEKVYNVFIVLTMKRVKLNFFQPHLHYPHYKLSRVWEGGPYWRLRKEVWRGQRLGATTKHFHGSLDPGYATGKAWLLVPGPHKLDFVSECAFSGCSHLLATLRKVGGQLFSG